MVVYLAGVRSVLMNTDERNEQIKEEKRKTALLKKVHAMMAFLEIPCANNYVNDEFMSVLDLYDILTNEEKLKVLVSKLRNKAFW
jgi:hypothetical protein